jgi:hypothetical protein
MSKLLTDEIRERLLRNGRLMRDCVDRGEVQPDFLPVVKLFTPDGGCTWLLTELDTDEPDIAFGLCDLGMGCPETGSDAGIVSRARSAFQTREDVVRLRRRGVDAWRGQSVRRVTARALHSGPHPASLDG